MELIYKFDRDQNIRQLKERLRYIASVTGEGEILPVDAAYDRNMTNAVSAFQRRYGLPVSGDVNLATWEMIHAVARQNRLQNELRPFHLSPLDFPLKIGSSGDVVAALQLILMTLQLQYEGITDAGVTLSGVFDVNTAKAVDAFRRANGEKNSTPADAEVDAALWNRMTYAYDLLRKRDV